MGPGGALDAALPVLGMTCPVSSITLLQKKCERRCPPAGLQWCTALHDPPLPAVQQARQELALLRPCCREGVAVMAFQAPQTERSFSRQEAHWQRNTMQPLSIVMIVIWSFWRAKLGQSSSPAARVRCCLRFQSSKLVTTQVFQSVPSA